MAIRKILLLQLISLSSIFYCKAGNNGSFTLGADAGPGLSALYGPSSYSNAIYNFHLVEPSITAGLNFRYNFPKIVSVGSGIYYCRFGIAGQENPDVVDPGLIFIRGYVGAWNVVNIPLLARVSFGKKALFFVETGPFLDITSKNSMAILGMTPQRTISAGITTAVGIEVPLPHRVALGFEVCSNVGLSNIADDGIVVNGLNYPYKNGYIKTYCCTLLCGFNYTLPVIVSKGKTPNKR